MTETRIPVAGGWHLFWQDPETGDWVDEGYEPAEPEDPEPEEPEPEPPSTPAPIVRPQVSKPVAVKSSPLPFEVLSGAALWAERPAVEYVVEGFLQRGKLGMICAVASGGKWLGRFACQQRKALYIDY